MNHSPIWPLNVLALTWIIFFCVCFWLYRPAKRAVIEDPLTSEDSVRTVPGGKTRYILRVRFYRYPLAEENSGKIIFKFFYFKDKVGTITLPIKTLIKSSAEFTDKSNNTYYSMVFDYVTTNRFTQCDEVRVGFTSPEESQDLTIKDLDLRQPQLDLRVTFIINSSFRSFPFSIADASYAGTPLGKEETETFRSDVELLTRGDMLVILFFQFNLTYVIINLEGIYIQLEKHSFFLVTGLAVISGLLSSLIATLLTATLGLGYAALKLMNSPLRVKVYRGLSSGYSMAVVVLAFCGGSTSALLKVSNFYKPMFKIVSNASASFFNTGIVVSLYVLYNCYVSIEKTPSRNFGRKLFNLLTRSDGRTKRYEKSSRN